LDSLLAVLGLEEVSLQLFFLFCEHELHLAVLVDLLEGLWFLEQAELAFAPFELDLFGLRDSKMLWSVFSPVLLPLALFAFLKVLASEPLLLSDLCDFFGSSK
jgi:hypothetical protein